MQALVYVSTATTLPTRNLVSAILDAAHRNNPKFGLTGMLLWKDMAFAQLLEGPADALDAMWDRLVADERHEDVRLLSRWTIESRFFGEWSMAGHRMNRRQHWELMERSAADGDEDFCAWILYLMNEVHRSAALS